MDQNQIHFKAEFIIDEGKIKGYKKLILEMSRMVEANEPSTTNYEFYLIKMRQSVLFMKHMRIRRQRLLITKVLHHKQYFQRFSMSLS